MSNKNEISNDTIKEEIKRRAKDKGCVYFKATQALSFLLQLWLQGYELAGVVYDAS